MLEAADRVRTHDEAAAIHASRRSWTGSCVAILTDTVITGLNILPTHMLYVLVHTQLHASHHVTCLRLPQWWLYWKEGILHLSFTQTRQQIAAFSNYSRIRLYSGHHERHTTAVQQSLTFYSLLYLYHYYYHKDSENKCLYGSRLRNTRRSVSEIRERTEEKKAFSSWDKSTREQVEELDSEQAVREMRLQTIWAIHSWHNT